MAMLHAKDPAFLTRYPHYATVYDARGRRIPHVSSCNPETGEVIRILPTKPGRQGSIVLDVSGGPLWRHGFWPAPLRVVPRPIWNGDPEQYAPVPRRAAADPEALL